MKKRFLLLLITVFSFINTTYSQERKISIQQKDKQLSEILNEIEAKSGYSFLVRSNDVDLKQKVTIDLKEKSVDEILTILFKNKGINYEVNGKNISIFIPQKLQNKTSLPKENKKITGIVTEEKGEPIIGASVKVNGTTIGVITDINGKFSLDVPEDSKLSISYIGYLSQEINVKNQHQLNIKLIENSKLLDEVVVVGYGIQKKADVTGSIAQVKGNQIQNTASANVSTALQGKVSGVYAMKSSGQAGAGADISIRGVTSLNGGSPLWIIDGVQGDPSSLNMNDVENIDIIKDGTAAAIYGVKAAAGVILVTTKRGLGETKTKISFNTYTGTSNAWRLPEMVNSDQYITLKNEQWATTGVPEGLNMDSIGKYPTTNWIKEMYKQGIVQNYDLTLSGSNETSNYYIGTTYFKEQPSFVDNSFEKYSFRINSDYKIRKWLKIGESLNLLYSKLNPVADGQRYLDGIFRTPPMMPVYDENNQPGGFGFVDYLSIGDFDGGNPMASQLMNRQLDYHQQVSGNIYATFTIIPGLTVTGTFAGGMTFDNSKNVALPYKLTDKKDFSTTDISLSFNRNWSMLFNVYANYVKDFGLNSIQLTAGYEASQYAGSNLNGRGTNAKFGLQVLSQTDVPRYAEGGESLGRSLSQFGRVNYQYDKKYIVQAVVRRDGSDKFGADNIYGVFPSVSFAWKLSEENFIKNLPAISFLKLRGGYGINGNDNIGQYNYTSYMQNARAYPYGTYSTVAQNVSIRQSYIMGNPAIKWEQSKQLDMGVELGLFKNALFFNVEVYQKLSDQMLFYKPLPTSSGLTDQYIKNSYQIVNAGLISNRGLDMSVTYKGNVGDFNYSLGANISSVNYRVEQLADNNPIFASPVLAAGSLVSKTTVGESSGYFYGYQCDGIFQTQAQIDEYNAKAREIALNQNPNLTPSALAQINYHTANTAPGDLIYRDLDGDGVITTADRQKIGSPWPKATYGLQASANFKGFDLLISSAGIYKRDVFNASKVKMYQFSSYDYSTTTLALSRWTPTNPSSTNYRINGNDPNKNMSNPSSWYIEDGSFFRIKNIELGFTFPKVWSSAIGFSRVRLYMSGQNLFTFTKYTGLDPEFGIGSAISSGVDNGSYPQSKIYMLGLQVDI
ncbi:MAG: hypothetical protein AUK44_02330 [Porphyromonadaceae bacterium CG2_30_38_12]|nr:MAG: hypothetical protein AUK44_02330 [Porphyromonadaceae bacterium CG2_30_38_12]